MAANKIDAFGHIVPEAQLKLSVPSDEGLLAQYTVELDKETGETHPVQTDPLSIPELVKSYEDTCGMEWAKRLLRSGQLSFDQICDDGKHGGDFTRPTEINVAFREAKAAKAQGDQVAQALGIEGYMKSEDLTALVNARVDEILKANAAAATKEGEAK